MTKDIENQILNHLERLRLDQERIAHDLEEIKTGLLALEVGQCSILQHIEGIGHDLEIILHPGQPR